MSLKTFLSSSGKCNYCGLVGQKEARCTAKQAPSSERIAKAAMASEDEAPYHSSFRKMYDTEEEDHSCAVTIIQSSVRTGHNALTRPTEAIFDTGATGSIITNKALLSEVSFISSTIFRGLAGEADGHSRGNRQGLLQPLCWDVNHFSVGMREQRTRMIAIPA